MTTRYEIEMLAIELYRASEYNKIHWYATLLRIRNLYRKMAVEMLDEIIT